MGISKLFKILTSYLQIILWLTTVNNKLIDNSCAYFLIVKLVKYLSVARSYKRGPPPSPRIMSPMGFAVHRQVYTDDIDFDYDYYSATDDQERQPTKPVPIWLCVFLVVSYILGGAYLFNQWEGWPFLESAYFCFITLTTIGLFPNN